MVWCLNYPPFLCSLYIKLAVFPYVSPFCLFPRSLSDWEWHREDDPKGGDESQIWFL